MPIDPITWAIFIGSFLAGAAVGYFWDEIAAWFSRTVKYILDNLINRAIEVTSEAIVYLIKQGKRYYKKAEVYVRNIFTKNTKLLSEQEEIAEVDIPDELNAQLEQKTKLELGRRAT